MPGARVDARWPLATARAESARTTVGRRARLGPPVALPPNYQLLTDYLAWRALVVAGTAANGGALWGVA